MDLSTILEQLQEWWNNGVAFANTTGLLNTLYVIGFTYLTYKYRKKNNAITIDVSQSSAETKKLAKEIEQQNDEINKLNVNIRLLTDLLFTFANSTKIDDKVKNSLAKIYGKIDVDDGKIKDVVKKVAETTEEVIDKAQEVKEPAKSAYEKIKSALENN